MSIKALKIVKEEFDNALASDSHSLHVSDPIREVLIDVKERITDRIEAEIKTECVETRKSSCWNPERMTPWD